VDVYSIYLCLTRVTIVVVVMVDFDSDVASVATAFGDLLEQAHEQMFALGTPRPPANLRKPSSTVRGAFGSIFCTQPTTVHAIGLVHAGGVLALPP
jgi:hypothetical protein